MYLCFVLNKFSFKPKARSYYYVHIINHAIYTTDRKREREIHTHTVRERETDRHRERQTERQTHRERQIETESQREREVDG